MPTPSAQTIAASIVIVSRGRPDALRLCLAGIAQLDHPQFEVIVVACPAGMAMLGEHPQRALIKAIAFDRANISEARNLGIAVAAGEVIAFIDDDAVPEPTWLAHLLGPFADPQVAAAGGYVRGRNGISFQWRARCVQGSGEDAPLHIAGDAPARPALPDGAALKLQGTNMAHRRTVLAAMGGFDPAFRFYLDETDLDMRHAARGHISVVVPLAEVHHGYAESPRRSARRVPRDLTEIGASMACFLARHCPEQDRGVAWQRFRDGQQHRLAALVARRALRRDDMQGLLRGLDQGFAQGANRSAAPLAAIPAAGAAFLPFPGRPGASRSVLLGRLWNRRALRREAAHRAAQGEIVSVFRFTHTALPHRLRFDAGGYWEQTGGLWGRSDRGGPRFVATLFRARLNAEITRVAKIRGLRTPSDH
ncbi:glycosyltransferase [Salipiger sp. 1_MG-2023]|uniref:glycosyltransferase family 2 protein n=1 Tax=Salipiger sp. 1_MG-2023 TaxID=3062665 RepID=UPI0026E2668E|nr:glycosyltransferase [Salipiger sp. 1_MG-2023]MDO6584253.1 glycosyltransferase [Salipiger sp. 1_MG-2023]